MKERIRLPKAHRAAIKVAEQRAKIARRVSHIALIPFFGTGISIPVIHILERHGVAPFPETIQAIGISGLLGGAISLIAGCVHATNQEKKEALQRKSVV